jgi:hypothetical protein
VLALEFGGAAGGFVGQSARLIIAAKIMPAIGVAVFAGIRFLLMKTSSTFSSKMRTPTFGFKDC